MLESRGVPASAEDTSPKTAQITPNDCATPAVAQIMSGNCVPTASPEVPSPEACGMTLVRLHVVAADDSPQSQRLKLEVRDAVLETARSVLGGCGSAGAAFAALTERREEFEASAKARAALRGFDGPIRAETGVFPFPERTYGGVTVPAGDYPALRVVIGEGAGRNWWCVLYPSLCLSSDCGYDSIFAGWFRKWFGGDRDARNA